MIENYLIIYGAPTLAGLKSGSLFNCVCENRVSFMLEVRLLNQELDSAGIKLIPLHFTDKKVLMLLYRPKKLASELKNPKAQKILQQEGYSNCTLQNALGHLIKRLRESGSFPHEIGLFLGYPAKDVEGFIENKGKNSLLTGMWKVYGDVDSAEKTFQKFRKCTEVYCKCYRMGSRLDKLAVAER